MVNRHTTYGPGESYLAMKRSEALTLVQRGWTLETSTSPSCQALFPGSATSAATLPLPPSKCGSSSLPPHRRQLLISRIVWEPSAPQPPVSSHAVLLVCPNKPPKGILNQVPFNFGSPWKAWPKHSRTLGKVARRCTQGIPWASLWPFCRLGHFRDNVLENPTHPVAWLRGWLLDPTSW